MPLNTLRLNHQKSSHPNDRITFIKALPRSASDKTSYEIADTFLRAVAAQCLPLMKKHYLSVTTLEEHEFNREFVGRNFNNGEVIQLVLRDKNGRWMPFNAVQMVMMHELSHNTHMNHGRDFWKTRNLYADEMKALWARGYTGEGFWGGGRTLNDMGTVMGNNILRSDEVGRLPVCGGTFRSRNRKRRSRQDKPELTWKEKRDRRIERKFGRNGITLGEDEDMRIQLEIGRKGPIGGKPRVAQSQRGRELRAAAALARFETNKKEAEDLQKAQQGQITHDDYEDDSDYEDLDADQDDARDVEGRKILDSRGRGMIRVCDDEDIDDLNIQHELQDLNSLFGYFKPFPSTQVPGPAKAGENGKHTEPTLSAPALESDTNPNHQSPREISDRNNSVAATPATTPAALPFLKAPGVTNTKGSQAASFPKVKVRVTKNISTLGTCALADSMSKPTTPDSISTEARKSTSPPLRPPTIPCPICSLENPRLNSTCMACSHVLDPRKDPMHWSCQSQACKSMGSAYVNGGDAGICGVCGVRKNNY